MARKPIIMFVTAALIALTVLSARADVSAQGTVEPTKPLPFFLLTIRGTLAPKTLDAARSLHNSTAGNPDSIAAARGLGDLSHMVYAPTSPATSGAGEILFIDQWSSADGLNKFFANPQVQQQAGQIFSQRDPVVWVPAEGFYTYHFPAPYGKNDRVVAMVRGTVRTRAEAMTIHNQIVASQMNAARLAGDLSHDVYFKLTPPGSSESVEFLAVDVWMSASGMAQYYQQPDFLSGAQKLFTAPPTTSTWLQTSGDWVEW